ncbi:hypothetical protein ACRJ4W_10875 [Streptomyces sp. GLT-R25]
MTFAHCALTFVDPDRGRQPFVSASGATALVLNGEIYNHEELRRELRAAGVRLRTAGDTEVLVELYELHGMKVLERVRGMYAFVLHDARTATTVLARDPMGKKPLYYTRVPGGIAFASELTALLRHPDAPRTPDVRALAGYLTLQAFCAPGSAVTPTCTRSAPAATWSTPVAGCAKWSSGGPGWRRTRGHRACGRPPHASRSCSGPRSPAGSRARTAGSVCC